MILARVFQKLHSACLKVWFRLNADGTLHFGKGVEVGRGCRIIVNKGGILRIGDYSVIEPGCLLHARSGLLSIGPTSFVGQNSVVVANERVEVGPDCLIAENVTIRDSNHRTDATPFRLQGCIAKPVAIGKNVWLGARVVVLPGVTLADDVIAGAGAVVTKSFPQGAKVVGTPAKAY